MVLIRESMTEIDVLSVLGRSTLLELPGLWPHSAERGRRCGPVAVVAVCKGMIGATVSLEPVRGVVATTAEERDNNEDRA